jgi:hypothetical protein
MKHRTDDCWHFLNAPAASAINQEKQRSANERHKRDESLGRPSKIKRSDMTPLFRGQAFNTPAAGQNMQPSGNARV